MVSRGETSVLDNILDNQISYSEAMRNLKPLPQSEKLVLDRLNNSCILYSQDKKGALIAAISKSSVEELRARSSELQSQGYDTTAYNSCLEDYEFIIAKNICKIV